MKGPRRTARGLCFRLRKCRGDDSCDSPPSVERRRDLGKMGVTYISSAFMPRWHVSWLRGAAGKAGAPGAARKVGCSSHTLSSAGPVTFTQHVMGTPAMVWDLTNGVRRSELTGPGRKRSLRKCNVVTSCVCTRVASKFSAQGKKKMLIARNHPLDILNHIPGSMRVAGTGSLANAASESL